MNTISIKNTAGIDLHINVAALSYIRLDPANDSRVLIYLNNGEFHTVKSTIEDIVKLFRLANK